VGATLGCPVGWEAWEALVRLETNAAAWIWTPDQVVQAEVISRLVDPTFLPGVQELYAKCPHWGPKGLPLEKLAKNLNEYMPKIAPAPKPARVVVAAAPIQEVSPWESRRMDLISRVSAAGGNKIFTGMLLQAKTDLDLDHIEGHLLNNIFDQQLDEVRAFIGGIAEGVARG
jgi:hypothetical protein